MKSSPSRLPSPALVIACVALFVSLGGVSYGLAKGSVDSRELKNNTIRSKDVRNNTLRTFDIRNNEVRGFDIRNSTVQGRDVAFNTLTGNDISEEALGKVPSATAADTAGVANSMATLRIVAPTGLAEGAEPVTLATHGPLTLLGACEAAGGATEAIVQVQTTEASSAAGGTTTTAPATSATATDPDFGPATVPVGTVDDLAGGARSLGSVQVFAFAPSNKAITGQVAAIANAAANSCIFHGHVALEG